MSDLSVSVKELLEKVNALHVSTQQKLALITDQCRNLADAGIKVAESWSGSFAGYHSELYYADFQKPSVHSQFSPEWGGINGMPNGWRSRTPDEVKDRIEELAGIKIEQVEKELANVVEETKALQKEVMIELSDLHDMKGLDREKQCFKLLEEISWKSSKGDFIDANTPQHIISRDSHAMTQGLRTPAHLYYRVVVYDVVSKTKRVEEFLSLSQQLLRMLGRKISVVVNTSVPNTTDVVKNLCLRFHLVARQLEHRHDARPTIKMNDEYDVQDLLHGLLRLHFDDVRPEEWTPSYAGGASRMDFLLKNEQVVIEAKMVRASLGEKQIGEQLIVDSVRYKSHPDCKVLVCFVYDPAGSLKNPRGIEGDLNKLSDPKLQVIAIIAP
jgi:hypothetical protein